MSGKTNRKGVKFSGFKKIFSIFYSLLTFSLVLGLSEVVDAACVGATLNFECGDTVTQSCTLNCNLNSNGTCFTIGADNIVIDGAGYSIHGNTSGNGIYASGKNNVKIKNFNIYNFYNGIVLDSSSNNIITNNTANSNGIFGIILLDSSNNTIKNNTANSNGYGGIYIFDNSNFNKISNNKISNNNETGITISNCNLLVGCYNDNSNNTIEYNEISNNNIGIYSQNSNSTINSNIFCGNTNLDFDSSDWPSSSGGNNTCNKPDGWNDTGTTGCTWSCPMEVETSTGKGGAYFAASNGTIENLIAVNESSLPQQGKPNLTFTYGFFGFNITGISYGATITVTITLPGNLPANSQYWKYGPDCDNGGSVEWYRIPMGSNDGDNTITINLTDGGMGDDNCTQDGKIFDDGGPGSLTIDSELCNGSQKDAFNPGEHVCTFGNATATCDIYKCDHRDDYAGYNLTANCISISTITGAFDNVSVCTGGDKNCTIGSAYDMVLDCNRDGYYNETTDAIDDNNTVGGLDDVAVSISSDNNSYNLGNVVQFTITVNITNGIVCILINANLTIKNGNSTVCSLPVSAGNYGNYGNCNLSVYVTESNYVKCHAGYGNDNFYTYRVNWTLPSGWSVGSYTARFNASTATLASTTQTAFTVTYKKGDINTDYKIDFLDFVWFARLHYNATTCSDPRYNPLADFDDDCDVDLLDFVKFARVYGTTYGP